MSTTRLYLTGLITVLLCLVFPQEGQVSRVHYRKADLQKLILFTEHVVAVRADDPAHSTEDIPIHKDTKKYPPYKLYKQHFIVTHVLYGKGIKAGEKIKVLSADYAAQLRLQKLYYLEGIRKSPIYDRYERQFSHEDDNEFIIFLKKSNDGYFFSMQGATEGLRLKNEVMKVIKNKQ